MHIYLMKVSLLDIFSVMQIESFVVVLCGKGKFFHCERGAK